MEEIYKGYIVTYNSMQELYREPAYLLYRRR